MSPAFTLVVAVTSDRYVGKGSGRPVFNQDFREEMVGAIWCVDFAFVNDHPTGVEAIRALRPDAFVKGQEFESGEDPTGRFQKEVAAAKGVKKKCPICKGTGRAGETIAHTPFHMKKIDNGIVCPNCTGTGEVGCEVRFTHEMVFSSTKLLKKLSNQER